MKTTKKHSAYMRIINLSSRFLHTYECILILLRSSIFASI